MYLYNPKLADPVRLEKMLVGRRDTADWLERIALLFAETGKPTHSLLIGNRGMGKSHLMNALYHRLVRAESVPKNMVIAFLDEDPYGITNYFDLLRHIIHVIAKREQTPVIKQSLLDTLKTLVGTKDEKLLIVNVERILIEHLAGRRLLLLIENLNVLFDALGEEGQGRWRDFLQTHDNTMICATAQAIFSGIQKRERSFFGFFHVAYLQKLCYEEARDLLLAMEEGPKNDELRAYIETPEGEAKLRAIFELTEGNHRLLVAFYEFFIAEFRSELSKSFLRTLDQLKPYYESFLKVLPPQQQKIVQFLVSERIPQPGRVIADNCFLPINTLSKQMSELQRIGYVQNTRQGRDAYYEITEPMLRMCLEANENTDGILSIFVDFLGNLYPIPDLKFNFLQFRLFADTTPDPNLRAKMSEEAYLYRKAVKRYAINWEPDSQELLQVREAPPNVQERWMRRMVEDSEFNQYRDKLYNLIDAKQYREAEALLEQAFPAHLSHYYWGFLGCLLNEEGRISEAEAAYKKSIAIKPTDPVVWNNLGTLLKDTNRIEEAEAAYKRAIEIKPDAALAWTNLAGLLENANRIEEAVIACEKTVEIQPDDVDAWYNLGILLERSNRKKEAENAFRKVLETDPQRLNTWVVLVNLFVETQQIDQAKHTIQMFAEKYEDELIQKTIAILWFDLFLWSKGETNLALDVIEGNEVWDKGESYLSLILVGISFSPKNFILDVLKSNKFNRFLKKCKKNALPRALQNATRFILKDKSRSTAELYDFHAALTEAFGQKTSMRYPLKFLHLGIRYVKENDPKALLELTLEERRVFEREVLGKSEEAE